MTPLLFAAALALSSPAAPTSPSADLGFTGPARPGTAAAEACAKLGIQTVAPDGTPILKKLGELPPAVLEHAVWRTVAGCPVREVVYKGQTYYLGPSIPKLESGPAVGNRLPRPATSPSDATRNR